MEQLLTPKQVAEKLQVHHFTVLQYIREGRLQAAKVGRSYRIRPEDVEAFLKQNAVRKEG